jgi:hypothetical protein
MAAENTADILVYEINGLSRPEYLPANTGMRLRYGLR